MILSLLLIFSSVGHASECKGCARIFLVGSLATGPKDGGLSGNLESMLRKFGIQCEVSGLGNPEFGSFKSAELLNQQEPADLTVFFIRPADLIQGYYEANGLAQGSWTEIRPLWWKLYFHQPSRTKRLRELLQQ